MGITLKTETPCPSSVIKIQKSETVTPKDPVDHSPSMESNDLATTAMDLSDIDKAKTDSCMPQKGQGGEKSVED